MGATRKSLFISLGIFFLSLSFIEAIAASIIQVLVSALNNKIGLDAFSFLHIAYFTNDTWLTRVVIDTSIMFFCFSILFFLGLLFYKYGLAGGGSVIGLFIIILLVGIAQGWVIDFFTNLFQSIDMVFFWQLLALGVVIYGLSLIFLKKITIKSVK
jgi:hypothetical protein